ncbi:MAG: hypothetical protein KatS3mg082_2286 [Nitrospiraceae bacterium]|nr:MAG: hypothetical protein KatS3mg082_2286 [Nitrospiraceae bacterium]
MRRVAVALMGPFPSKGWPMALTTRPISASPTGTSAMRPVRLTRFAFFDSGIVAHQHDTDVVFFEVQSNAVQSAREFQHLTGHGAVKAVDFGNAIAHLNDGTRLIHIDVFVEALNLFFEDRGDLFGLDLHGYSFVKRLCIAVSRPRRVPSMTVLPI